MLILNIISILYKIKFQNQKSLKTLYVFVVFFLYKEFVFKVLRFFAKTIKNTLRLGGFISLHYLQQNTVK
jgi:hypothetical protein